MLVIRLAYCISDLSNLFDHYMNSERMTNLLQKRAALFLRQHLRRKLGRAEAHIALGAAADCLDAALHARACRCRTSMSKQHCPCLAEAQVFQSSHLREG